MRRYGQKHAAGQGGKNLEHAHLLNQRVILQAVRLQGPVTRVQLARLTGLTHTTAVNIVTGLQRSGWIRNVGRETGQRGPPATLYEPNADAAFSIGLHIERDHAVAVLVDFAGTIRARAHHTGYVATPKDALRPALGLVRELRRKLGRKRLCGLGIALPGPLDFKKGRLTFAPNFRGLENLDLKAYFSQKTGLPVIVDNDATAAAIGESWHGVARALKGFVYLYVGVGLGGGIVVDGRPYRGFRGNAGEVGHVVVDRSEAARACGCGKKGCLGTYVCLGALWRHLREAGLGEPGLVDLANLFEQRRSALMGWLDTAATHLADAIENLQAVLDPEAFVVGGYLPGPLLAYLRERCLHDLGARRHARWENSPPLLEGSLREEVAALGAATLPIYHLIAPNYEASSTDNDLNLLELEEPNRPGIRGGPP